MNHRILGPARLGSSATTVSTRGVREPARGGLSTATDLAALHRYWGHGARPASGARSSVLKPSVPKLVSECRSTVPAPHANVDGSPSALAGTNSWISVPTIVNVTGVTSSDPPDSTGLRSKRSPLNCAPSHSTSTKNSQGADWPPENGSP